MQIYLPIAEVSVNAFLLLGLGGIVGVLWRSSGVYVLVSPKPSV